MGQAGQATTGISPRADVTADQRIAGNFVARGLGSLRRRSGDSDSPEGRAPLGHGGDGWGIIVRRQTSLAKTGLCGASPVSARTRTAGKIVSQRNGHGVCGSPCKRVASILRKSAHQCVGDRNDFIAARHRGTLPGRMGLVRRENPAEAVKKDGDEKNEVSGNDQPVGDGGRFYRPALN
jgi:hypothetical protein